MNYKQQIQAILTEMREAGQTGTISIMLAEIITEQDIDTQEWIMHHIEQITIKQVKQLCNQTKQ